MAFSSVSRIRMRVRADGGDRRAQRVLSILDNYDDSLTALLIGNNVMNIALATIATVVATNTWGVGAVTLATLVTTVLLFMLGETLPKTLAKGASESIALRTCGILSGLTLVLRPIIFVLGKITAALSRPFRKAPQPTVTEEDLRDLIAGATREGGLSEETGELVQSAIRYGGATVRDILTPWKKVRKLPVSMPADEVLSIIKDTHHSRLPVVDETGEPLGMVRIRRYLSQALRGKQPPSLQDAVEPAPAYPVTMPIDDLLRALSAEKTHLALVHDEWENVLGVVTVEDILEALVGDIWDEDDEVMLGGDAR